MPTASARETLDNQFLTMRCGLLDLAAAFDRIERAAGAVELGDDAQLTQLREGIAILASSGPDRAERLQLLFSDSYQAGWNQ